MKKQNWLQIFFVIVLVLGVFFRFVNLDRKVYWYDEVFTSLRISGYTQTELVQQVFDGDEISAKDLQKYQRPNSEKGLSDTIKGLATEEPQHPPLYFVLARFWVQLFGSSVAATRSLSALISLLVFPCIYWLCLELFKSPLTGWVAMALIAVSPFHVVYAQEARQYSLWTVIILLSSALLLRAIRLGTKLNWGMYALSVAIGLYTFPFSAFVVISHGIYLVVIEKFKLNQRVINYFLAVFAGVLAFVPWLIVMINNLVTIQGTTSSSTRKTSILTLVKDWIHNIKLVFVSLDIGSYLAPLILLLVGYSFYFIFRRTSKQVWLFILTLIAVMALALILPDLILGGQRSGSVNIRYFIPCYLGIELAVAHLLASKIISAKSSQRKLWQGLMVLLISAGVASCAYASPSHTSFSKVAGSYNPQMAGIINQSTHPLVISDTAILGNDGDLISLSYSLNPNVRLRLVDNPTVLQIPDTFSNVFLYNPSKALQDYLEPKYKLKLIFEESGRKLWQLKKP